MAETKISNSEFARRARVDVTTASRLRNGQRLPKHDLFARIVKEFKLDAQEATRAYGQGAEVFGRFLDEQVFGRTREEAAADQRFGDASRAPGGEGGVGAGRVSAEACA